MSRRWTRALAVLAALLTGLPTASCAVMGGEAEPIATSTADAALVTGVAETATAIPGPIATLPGPTEALAETLGNLAYQGILDEPVVLAGGHFEGEPFVAGGASRPTVQLLPGPVALGNLNGDGQPDAAVLLASNYGGSGTYLYLATVELRDGVWTNNATTPLGDRLQPQGLAIENGRIALALLSHNENDPACCPSVVVERRFRLNGGQLVEAED